MVLQFRDRLSRVQSKENVLSNKLIDGIYRNALDIQVKNIEYMEKINFIVYTAELRTSNWQGVRSPICGIQHTFVHSISRLYIENIFLSVFHCDRIGIYQSLNKFFEKKSDSFAWFRIGSNLNTNEIFDSLQLSLVRYY